ncbi:MAG: imidazolonepropionase [Deltaproteobacteria bacterium]|nr:imidazolonepropionase [Deltaproteobacteria bacterium]
MKKNIIIKNASEIVTCSGFSAKQGSSMSDIGLLHGGAIVVENGIIKNVGDSSILKNIDESNYTVIDATGKTVLPGYIDPHTHFVFGGYRPDEYDMRLKGKPYMEIMEKGGGIINSVHATRKASKDELLKAGTKRLDSMLSFGVTTVEGKSGYGLDLDTEIKQLEVMKDLNNSHCVDIAPTFLGAHAVPKEYIGKSSEYIDYVIESVLPVVAEKKLAEFCDIFCEQNVFSVDESRKLLKRAKDLGLKPKIHADEIIQLGGAELAAELSAVSADHLLKSSDAGIKAMAEKNVVATLLPGTAFSLKESYARGRYMIDNGSAIALATDMNPGSCFTESIPLIFSLATLYMDITTEEAITALTINAAAAISREKDIGSIDTGKKADIQILEFPSYKFIPYHIGVSTVETVIKDGKIVYGNH